MANFDDQVMGLTGLSIDANSTPNRVEFTQFLYDGVLDVTERLTDKNAMDKGLFNRVTSELTSNGHSLGGAEVISVVREDGTVNSWRPCREISPALQTRVTDSDSLHYASKYNPAFIKWNDGSVAVYPAPGDSPNRYKIFYVNNVPTFSGGGGEGTWDTDVIHYFPKDKVHLVMMFAAIKCIDHKLSAYVIDDDDTELAEGLKATLESLTYKYERAFGEKPQQQQQPAQRRRRRRG